MFAPVLREQANPTRRHSSTSGGAPPDHLEPVGGSIRLAVAQTTLFSDPRDGSALHLAGLELRRLMRAASQAGARVVHFPEGATCAPNKRIMSASGPSEVGPADWTRFAWGPLGEELEAIRILAGELGLWTVFGSVHRLSPPHRPHNSLYVLSDRGELVTRYDERMLSNTKVSFMYTPGSMPVVFEVDALRFGCALGMEAHYPELFSEYERLEVDCVLFSTTGESAAAGPAFAAEALGHAAANSCWVSFSAHSPQSVTAPSGIAAPDGRWAAQCSVDTRASIAVADIMADAGEMARTWRRTARSGLYDRHRVGGDSRSDSRDMF